MKRFLIFAFLVVIIAISSLFVHEAVHFVSCFLVGGIPSFSIFSPFDAMGKLGAFGFSGALVVSCSVTYLNSFLREIIAYSVQAIFVAILVIVSFRLVRL